MKSKKQTIGVIGGGNMGSAIIAGIYKDYTINLCEADKSRSLNLKKKFKVNVVGLDLAVKNSKIIILAVKPQDFDSVLSQIAQFITAQHLIVSIAAGITTTYIEKRLPKGVRVIRTMPNLPAQVKRGVTGICVGKHSTQKDLKLAINIFGQVGETFVVKEKLIDAITAISGSGPAYVFLFVECFNKAAVKLGISSEFSKKMINQTILGSLDLLHQQKEEASILRERVTSKGGTTQAALEVFLKNKIESIFEQALKAAKNRAKELSK